MATGYENIGVTKTIVLPVPPEGTELTIEEYKEKFGVDLSKFIVLDKDAGTIKFDCQWCLTLLKYTGKAGMAKGPVSGYEHYVLPITYSAITGHSAGTGDGSLILGEYSYGLESVLGIQFYCDRNKEFSLENIVVTSIES